MTDRDERQYNGTRADRGWQLTLKDWLWLLFSIAALAVTGIGYAMKQNDRLTSLETRFMALEEKVSENMDRCDESLGYIRTDLRDLNQKIDRLIERQAE